MLTKEQIRDLNTIYLLLEAKQKTIKAALIDLTDRIVIGWYNGHYRRNCRGEWEYGAYPIPEVDLIGLCDVEIHFDCICITAKLHRDKSLDYAFDRLEDYPFETYGVQDYLLDFYHDGLTLEDMKQNIRKSREDEIGFTFTLPFDTNVEEIRRLILLLREEGFYY